MEDQPCARWPVAGDSRTVDDELLEGPRGRRSGALQLFSPVDLSRRTCLTNASAFTSEASPIGTFRAEQHLFLLLLPSLFVSHRQHLPKRAALVADTPQLMDTGAMLTERSDDARSNARKNSQVITVVQNRTAGLSAVTAWQNASLSRTGSVI